MILSELRWTASYRAKKITRLAGSLYRSNMVAPRDQRITDACERATQSEPASLLESKVKIKDFEAHPCVFRTAKAAR